LEEDDEPLPEEGGWVVLLLLLLLPLPLPVAGALLLAGGVVAGAADGVECCLAQAVNSKAAASALRATLVFIDSTPVE
jgi:hypothetical protein